MRNKIQDVMRRRANGEKGFTLVELLVVVIILVVLAAVAVPIFLNQKTKADESAAQSTAAQAAQVLQGQRSVNGLASANQAASTDAVTFTGSTGNVTVDAGNIYKDPTQVVAADRLYDLNDPVGSAWCVDATSGTSSFHQEAGDTTPQSGLCI